MSCVVCYEDKCVCRTSKSIIGEHIGVDEIIQEVLEDELKEIVAYDAAMGKISPHLVGE